MLISSISLHLLLFIDKLVVLIINIMSLRIKPIQALLTSGTTVFTTDDLRQLWPSPTDNALKLKITYYVRTRQIIRLTQGIYALDAEYNPLELAQKLQTPSYISLDTALRKMGIIQQYSTEITCIGMYPRTYDVDGKHIRYHQMTTTLLSYPLGIEQTATYAIALPERALVDALYLGFQPDVGRHRHWDTHLLGKLIKEFAVPRVLQGLQQYKIL